MGIEVCPRLRAGLDLNADSPRKDKPAEESKNCHADYDDDDADADCCYHCNYFCYS